MAENLLYVGYGWMDIWMDGQTGGCHTKSISHTEQLSPEEHHVFVRVWGAHAPLHIITLLVTFCKWGLKQVKPDKVLEVICLFCQGIGSPIQINHLQYCQFSGLSTFHLQKCREVCREQLKRGEFLKCPFLRPSAMSQKTVPRMKVMLYLLQRKRSKKEKWISQGKNAS